MADLIRNPDSKNLLYIDPSEFPIFGSNESLRITLNDTGENQGTFNLRVVSASGAQSLTLKTSESIRDEIRETLNNYNYTPDTAIHVGVPYGWYDYYGLIIARPIFLNGDDVVYEPKSFNYIGFLQPGIEVWAYYIDDAEAVKGCDGVCLQINYRGSNYTEAEAHFYAVLGAATSEEAWESAYMEEQLYDVQFFDPSGTNQQVTHSGLASGSPTPDPPTWTRPGYEFGSWIPSVSPTVTKNQQYMAQWATAGSGKLPVTLDRMRVWADANGYPAGPSITNADKTVLTYAQLAEMAGGTGGAMAADGSEYVTLEQFREWANSGGGGGSPLDAYPVGSIYLSTSSTSPQTLFGGSWTRIQDTFLLCAGSTYAAGSTGGEAEHTLTVDEMPSHSHDVSITTLSSVSNNASPRYNTGTRTSDGYKSTLSYESSFTGNSQPHNNMPPYLSVYAWKRIA